MANHRRRLAFLAQRGGEPISRQGFPRGTVFRRPKPLVPGRSAVCAGKKPDTSHTLEIDPSSRRGRAARTDVRSSPPTLIVPVGRSADGSFSENPFIFREIQPLWAFAGTENGVCPGHPSTQWHAFFSPRCQRAWLTEKEKGTEGISCWNLVSNSPSQRVDRLTIKFTPSPFPNP